MKQALLMSITVFAMFIYACGEKDPVSTTTKVTGTDAVIAWQDCADFTDQDLTICFVNAEEYRCPCNMECVWAGAVNATFHVTSTAGIDTTITLSTLGDTGMPPQSAVVAGKTIRFVDTDGVDCQNFGLYDHYKVKITVE